MSDAAPLRFTPTLAPEDQARANLYGLVARLFYGAPDDQLIAELLGAPALEGEGALADAWREMVAGCRNAFPAVLENEHTELFIGTGKAEITPYLSHYVLRHANDNPLVALRQHLASWGIARREEVPEYEDHVSGACETMRFAIAVQHRSIEEQREFFDRFLYRGAIALCDAVSASEKARFYVRVARFARAFLDVENEAFRIA